MRVSKNGKIFGFQKGYTPWITGKKHSTKTKKKMSLSHTGKKFAEEHCKNLSETQKEYLKLHKHQVAGWKHSEEAKRKMSKAKKGKQLPKKHMERLWKMNAAEEGRRTKNGKYYTIKNSKHPFATKTGWVSEHRLIAEKFIGRYLKPSEIVHHNDDNGYNNAPANLHIFKNKGIHTAFHVLLNAKYFTRNFLKSNLTTYV